MAKWRPDEHVDLQMLSGPRRGRGRPANQQVGRETRRTRKRDRCNGFVATCNSTHFFIVRDDDVWTSTGNYCLRGITRGNIIDLCGENGIAVFERDFSLVDVYGANEAFVTGTFAGVTPVTEIDGRIIGDGRCGTMTQQLQGLYRELIDGICAG